MTSSAKHRLKIVCQPEGYVIINSIFKIEIRIVDEDDKTKYCNTALQLITKIFWAEISPIQFCPMGLVEVTNPLFIGRDGLVTADVKITDISANYGNKKICLSFEVPRQEGLEIDPTPILTTSLYCVRQKLCVETRDEKEVTLSSPYTWYKDEGGRDKCIELQVKLVDEKNRAILNRSIPLRATVLYENGRVVEMQNIMVINMNESKTVIDKSGMGILKFRINEVSSKHRDQRFKILVSPEDSTDFADIGPACSIALDIKSKRNNKRAREDESNGHNNQHNNNNNSSSNGLSTNDLKRGQSDSQSSQSSSNDNIPPPPPFITVYRQCSYQSYQYQLMTLEMH